MPLETLISAWGLPAIFVGSILEGEGVAFLGGVLVHRGLFAFEAAALAATAGAFVVDQTVFHIGRHSARVPFARRLLAKPVAQNVLARLERKPLLACLGVRFIYGMKTLGALALGASGIAPATYLLLDAISVTVWAHIVTALGYGASNGIETMLGKLSLHRHLAIAVAVLAAALIAAHFARRHYMRR